jgi:hypothetical protein
MAFTRKIWLASILLFAEMASAGTKVSFDFEPTHPYSAPCPRSPFIVLPEPSPFFADLKEVTKHGLLQYRRGKNVVQSFPKELEINISFLPAPLLARCGPKFDPGTLRFHVEWQNGTQNRQAIGTVVQEKTARLDTWCEENCIRSWNYELRIDSEEIPLTSSLLIRVDSETGVPIVEYVGKLTQVEHREMLTSNPSPAP